MSLVLNEYTGDGVTTTFNFSMVGGYLSREFVVFLTRPNDKLLEYSPYTGTVVWLSDFSVRVSDPIPAGTTFVITRRTTASALVDFQNTSRITERNLDTAFGQSLHRTAELEDVTARRAEASSLLAEAAVAAAQDAAESAATSATYAATATSLVEAANAAAGSSSAFAHEAAGHAEAATDTADAALALIQQAVKGNVDSFNGRDGAVLPERGDYTPDMVGFEYTGVLTPTADFSLVPSWSNPMLNAQAQALANRSELLRENQKRSPMHFATYAGASAAAATLPDGQRVEIDDDETRDGLGTLYNVGSGALVFVSYTEQLRQDIRESGGASLVGFDGETVASYFRSKNCRVVDSISELRALPKSTYARASATGYYSAGDGGGDYWLDTADTTSADNGGTIIVAADGGRWKRVDNRHDVKVFGARGDHNGTTGTDDTDAIDRYLTWAMVAGVKAQFPSGLYQYSGSKLFDMAGSPGWTDGKRKFAITGESLSSTGIVYTGSAEYMWHIKGTYPAVDLFEISDMFFIGRGAAVNVATPFKLENLLLPEFRRLAFCGLKQAAWGSSITSVKWDQVLVTYCKQIGEFYRGLSPCNIMEFSNCEFTACNSAASALTLSESVSIKFRSTGFEGNTAGVAIVCLINSGSDGVAGVDFDNCYFEGNKAIADVLINHINTCTYSFHQTTFNRTNATNYTTTNIYIDPVTLSAGGPECSLVISGGGFKSAGTYVPSPERPSVVFALGDGGTYDGYTINDEGAVWTHAADKPVYPQKARLLNSRSRVKAAVRCTAAGGIVSSYGVTGVTKTGTGVYVVTLAHGLDVTAIPQVTLFGTGFGFVSSDSGNTITVETRNTAATATNLPFSLSVT